MTLETNLKVVGVLQILLALLHVFFPRRFGWREELPRLSLLNRQMFQVHTFFIALVVALFGVLSLGFANLLAEQTALAKVVLLGLFVFWFIRLFVQFFVYESRLWRGHRFNTYAHIFFSLLWIYFTATYGWAWVRQ